MVIEVTIKDTSDRKCRPNVFFFLTKVLNFQFFSIKAQLYHYWIIHFYLFKCTFSFSSRSSKWYIYSACFSIRLRVLWPRLSKIRELSLLLKAKLFLKMEIFASAGGGINSQYGLEVHISFSSHHI